MKSINEQAKATAHAVLVVGPHQGSLKLFSSLSFVERGVQSDKPQDQRSQLRGHAIRHHEEFWFISL